MIAGFLQKACYLSRGTLAPKKTMEGFYLGESVPVNQKLSDLFLQLHISERSGRGVPKITEVYRKEAIEFRTNSIVVSIPFEYLEMNEVADKPIDKVVDKPTAKISTREKILLEIRNNPNVTQPQLAIIVGIGKTAVQNHISYLKKHGYIERIGSNKIGYWKVNDEL